MRAVETIVDANMEQKVIITEGVEKIWEPIERVGSISGSDYLVNSLKVTEEVQ